MADLERSRPPVGTATVTRVVTRVLGVGVVDVRELAGGSYCRTFRVDLREDEPVVVRFAPPESQQLASERHLMRNEVAGTPLLQPVLPVPRLLASDTSHTLVDRDVVVQSWLPGVPAAEALTRSGDRDALVLWEQLGALLARVHAVGGSTYGRPGGPGSATWSQELGRRFTLLALDLERAGLPPVAVHRCADLVSREADRLDERPPRLLHGDLGPGNVLVAGPDRLEVVGVVDNDRVWWGDPPADWTWYLVDRRRPAQQEAFWSGYGGRPAVEAEVLGLYAARSTAEAALEAHRLGLGDRLSQHLSELTQQVDRLT
ncbi:phosphotransferase family protein [Desertihabitans aurantiacus]|uniref:phosphotransferase family protein n=1 Tax=Desertihabitans aurantiacus TaxID=2282477 RepID=UPI001300BD5C|nr:aminoglycoside phosphotransferase family protein [Desertihabitans aurantiacus]